MNLSRFLEATRGGCTLEAAMDAQLYWKGPKAPKETAGQKAQSAAQLDVINRGKDWLNAGGLDDNYGGVEGFDPVAGFTKGQQQALGTLNQSGMDLNKIYSGIGQESLRDTLGQYDPSKTGLNAAIAGANEQSQFDFETGQMGNIRQGATNAGQYGSTRAGIAEGLARGRLAQGQNAAASQLAFQDQQQFNQNKQSALQNLSAISQGLNSGATTQLDTGKYQQAQDQAEIDGALQKWMYENNVGLNELQAYSGLVNGQNIPQYQAGAKGPGKGQSALAGAAAGATAGSAFGPWGTAIGGVVGGIGGYMGA